MKGATESVRQGATQTGHVRCVKRCFSEMKAHLPLWQPGPRLCVDTVWRGVQARVSEPDREASSVPYGPGLHGCQWCRTFVHRRQNSQRHNTAEEHGAISTATVSLHIPGRQCALSSCQGGQQLETPEQHDDTGLTCRISGSQSD